MKKICWKMQIQGSNPLILKNLGYMNPVSIMKVSDLNNYSFHRFSQWTISLNLGIFTKTYQKSEYKKSTACNVCQKNFGIFSKPRTWFLSDIRLFTK